LNKDTLIIGALFAGVAALAMFKYSEPVKVLEPVFVDKPVLVEVPTALISPQPNIFTSYNIDAGVESGAIAFPNPPSVTVPSTKDYSNEPGFIAQYDEYMKSKEGTIGIRGIS